MSKSRGPAAAPTKKHLARAQRERIQRRWVLAGTGVIALAIVFLIAYGWYDTTYIKPSRPIAEVNGEPISVREFVGRVRFAQRELVSQYNSALQLSQAFASDPAIMQNLNNRIQQIQARMADPESIGQDVIEQLVREAILRQEAEKQGISVTEEDIQDGIYEMFGYYPGGTPTPLPTLTPAPTATLDPTETLEPSPEPSPTAQGTPEPTATPYTEEGFQADYVRFIDSLKEFHITEHDFRELMAAQILERKMRENFDASDVPTTQEHVQVSHILVEDEETAKEVYEKAQAGEAWDELVKAYSTDALTLDSGGDLGWMTLGDLVNRFGQAGLATFATEVGKFAGPLDAEDGWHVFRISGREERALSEGAYQQAVNSAFDRWLSDLRASADVQIEENWKVYLPNPL